MSKDFTVSCLLGTFVGLLLGSADAHAAGRFLSVAEYAQSSHAWALVGDIRSAQGNIQAIDSILRQNYGTYEAALGRLEFGMRWQEWHVKLLSEATATGRIQNPVVPELHATGIVGMLGEIGRRFPGETPLELSLLAGSGNEWRVDAFSTDIIEKIPIRRGHFLLLGARQNLARELGSWSSLKWDLHARLTELAVRTDAPNSPLAEDQSSTFLGLSWNTRLEARLEDWRPGLSGGFHFTAGPHPLPQDVLPVVWQYANKTAALPELGTMVGAGLELRRETARMHVAWTGGFYGGYLGSGLDFQRGSLSARFSTWGIEASAAYRTLGQRLWLASISLQP